MIQLQFMASWAPTFVSAMEAEKAAKDNRPPFVTFQLATVNQEGFPHNRTLVYRGFLFGDKTNNVLTFCTDKRTEKYQELLHNDRFEAVFYFEKTKKQFRFRGRARLVDDVHTPVFDLTTVQPKHVIASNINSRVNSSDEDDSEEERNELEFSVKAQMERRNPSYDPADGSCSQTVQGTPLPYPIISPRQVQQIKSEDNSTSASFANLHEIASVEFTAPTSEEWDNEITRVWSSLSKSIRSGFRGPDPGDSLSDANQNTIDKITRGVDGKKEISGLKNFALVAMFIDYVDYYDMEKGRRYIYRRDNSNHWDEQEVCP